MTGARTLALAACVLLCGRGNAAAQTYIGPDKPHAGTFEVSGGGAFVSGFDMGSRRATLTRSTATERYDLFSSESEVSGFPGLYARAGLYLSRAIAVEGGLRYSRPELSTRLSNDAESAPDETAIEVASSYVIDGSILFHLTGLAFAGGRGVPFLSGGGGYLRELHEKNQLVETGTEYHATIGLKYWFGTGGQRFGIRVEGGLSGRDKGFDPEGERQILPMVLGGVSFMF